VEGPGRIGVAGAEGRAEVEGAEVGGAGVAEGDWASYLLALDFWVPIKVTKGSSRFQQFFLI